MLYLNNELLTSEKIITYFEKNLQELQTVPKLGTNIPSKLNQLKTKLKTNFFPDLVGCDLRLMSIPPGEINLNTLPKDTKAPPCLLKQDEKYFIYGPSKNKDWILTELNSAHIKKENLPFPDINTEAKALPYNMQYKHLYKEIASQNERQITGCDIALISVSEQTPRDQKPTIPVIAKDISFGGMFFIYAPTKKWMACPLSNTALKGVVFPDVGAEAKTLSFNTQYNHLYDEIVSSNYFGIKLDISMNKTATLNISLNQKPSDQEMSKALATEDRFLSNYPKLTQILDKIFALTDADDKQQALNELKAIPGTDWNMDNAEEQFKQFEDKYGYFKNTSLDALSIFTELAIACRTMVVLFEQNNTPNDTMAYDYAYKLMALFIDPASKEKDTKKIIDSIATSTYKLIGNTDSDNTHPLHDALLVKLAQLPHADKLKDRAGWCKLVKEQGIKSFPFIMMAEKIEAKTNEKGNKTGYRAPISMNEATKLAALCRYENSNKDAGFAELCHHYNVPEEIFNECLDFMASGWPKKTIDSIPDIPIKIKDEAAGLYWVKLPSTDKRALILGHITDCCQSIGGHSDQCVRDAVSLSDNGLYVLVKQQKKGNPPLIIEGEINDKDFKVIGQAYAWKSQTGNLCLDSIECLKNEIPDATLKKITSDWAIQVLQQHSDIKWITAGRGGKTPRHLFEDMTIPETIRQGTQYADSLKQYCIAKTPSSLSDTQQQALNTLLQPYSPSFKNSIDYLTHYLPASESFVEPLQTLLTDYPAFTTDLTPNSLPIFLALTPSPTLTDFTPIDFDALENMEPEQKKERLNNISKAQLVWNGGKTLKNLEQAIQYIPENERLNILLIMFSRGSERKFGRALLWCNNLSKISHEFENNSSSLINIINTLPEKDKSTLMLAKDQKGNDLLRITIQNHDSTLLSIILKSYSDKKQLMQALNNTDYYNMGSPLTEALHMSNSNISSQILDHLSEQELIESISKSTIFSNFNHISKKSFTPLLNNPSNEAALLTLLNTKDKKGKTAWDYAAKNPELLAALPKKHETNTFPIKDTTNNAKKVINDLKAITFSSDTPHKTESVSKDSITNSLNTIQYLPSFSSRVIQDNDDGTYIIKHTDKNNTPLSRHNITVSKDKISSAILDDDEEIQRYKAQVMFQTYLSQGNKASDLVVGGPIERYPIMQQTLEKLKNEADAHFGVWTKPQA